MLLLVHAWHFALLTLKFTIRFIWILSYNVRRSISNAFSWIWKNPYNLYAQFHSILIYRRFNLSPDAGGIPNSTNKTFIHWYISEKLIPKSTTYTTLRFLDLTDFNEHICISILLMILALKAISLDCDAMFKNRDIQYWFFFLHTAFCLTLGGKYVAHSNKKWIQKPNCRGSPVPWRNGKKIAE
jgi:hypothetical protein